MAAIIEIKHPAEVPRGGAFLLSEVGSARVLAPESFTEEQRLYYRTAIRFSREKVLPHADRIERKDHPLLRELLAEAGALGLLMIDIPEQYGGLGADKTSSMLVAEASALLASWSV